MRVFIDSNIPMYVAGSAHPHREVAKRFLRRVQAREIEGCTSTEVLQEILYRYSALRKLDLASDVYDLFVQICPVVFEISLADTDRARDLLMANPQLSARDAVHAAVMNNRDVQWIATFDQGFDGVPGIQRFELA